MFGKKNRKSRIKQKKYLPRAVKTLFCCRFRYENRILHTFFFDPNFDVNPGPERDEPLGLAGWMAGWVAGSKTKSILSHQNPDQQQKKVRGLGWGPWVPRGQLGPWPWALAPGPPIIMLERDQLHGRPFPWTVKRWPALKLWFLHWKTVLSG